MIAGKSRDHGTRKDDPPDLTVVRARSVTTLVAPVSLVAVLIANTAYLASRLGVREEKLDTVAASVGEIKAEMYRRIDAAKDREIIDMEISDLTRRIEVLEAIHRQRSASARRGRSDADSP